MEKIKDRIEKFQKFIFKKILTGVFSCLDQRWQSSKYQIVQKFAICSMNTLAKITICSTGQNFRNMSQNKKFPKTYRARSKNSLIYYGSGLNLC
jgi:hypothetical protein